MDDWLWLFATAGGAAILGLAIYYGVLRSKTHRPTRGTQMKSEQETRRAYEDATDR